ncbi:MAG: BrnT family toxin [Candidatus Tectomicrobia bacterium]|uniref:BrnT family toxin n=1 Tax=Tectimicrobiota bacterium TaxID=2528274 RepID=A0A932GS28_UNCTE|nr:BrnT family toxin [Candidatus Tectomicrobia bacterium]
MSLRFEWDPKKAAANLAKHGVSFEEGLTAFSDPLARIFDDEDHSSEEEREIIIGHSTQHRLLLVCFTARGASIRIFSARKATRRERQDYEENVSS